MVGGDNGCTNTSRFSYLRYIEEIETINLTLPHRMYRNSSTRLDDALVRLHLPLFSFSLYLYVSLLKYLI